MSAARDVRPEELRLFGGADEPWIEQVIGLAERSLGEPWRHLRERIAEAPLRETRTRVAAIVSALRRLGGGGAERANIARKLRSEVLGHPALDADLRAARVAAASAALGIMTEDLESLLWADLAHERPVVFPHGRPAAGMLAALANVDSIHRALRRANAIDVRVWSDPTPLVRRATRCGLIVSVRREADGATMVELIGPLSLFHATTIYGRALGALVPLLAAHARFTLDIHRDVEGGRRTLRVQPPVLLPAASPPRRRRSPFNVADRLARALVRVGCSVERDPEPLLSGAHVLFPELVVERAGARAAVEIIGFSTEASLREMRARYGAIGRPAVFCLDARGAPPDTVDGRDVVRFTREVDAEAVLRVLTRGPAP